MDDKIAQFRAVTNSDLETAIHMLEACDGNLESAIDCFLQQNEGGDRGGGGTEVEGPSGSGASASAAVNDELVRAPIAAKAGVLVEESFHRSYAPVRRPRQTNSVFSRFRDFEAETKAKEESLFGRKSNKASGIESKRKTLETLFRPPLEIMHRGTFETAKADASSRGQWLMVNVQKTDEFACQALNRDVWNNSAVQELIRSNFILWQIYNDSADGQRFETYYRVTSYPFVCILDPRTGELLTTLKTNDPLVFCDAISNFLDQHPSFKNDSCSASRPPLSLEEQFASTATATIPKNRFKSVASSSGGLRGGGKRRWDGNGDANGAQNGQSNGSNGMVNDYEEPQSKVVRMDDEDSSSGVSTSSAASFITKGATGGSVQTVNGEGTLVPFGKPDIRLMFRLPDGGKRLLSASKYSTVQEVLSYAEKEWGLLLANHDFVMNFPTRRLNKEDPKRTLESLGVQKQDVIYVEEI